jgi:geranylgeranyl diphosphate synthase, type II
MHGRAKMTEGRYAPGPVTPAVVASLREAIDVRLGALVPPADAAPVTLNRAVRHALLAPGKRVRPLLTMLAAAQFGADPRRALDAGCAVELVHTASLVLDDLPCMDDARTRRGQPSTHAAFGEATAVLAAIAMLTRAFGLLGSIEGISPEARLDLLAILSRASGTEGLAAGQERDLKDRSFGDAVTKIDDINDLKTGVLFTAAVQMGGRIADCPPAVMEALGLLGREVGNAFQTLDDMIDLSRSSAQAGKDTGKDTGKGTIASSRGLNEARGEVRRHTALALAAIEPFTPPDGPLGSFVAAMFADAVTSIEGKAAK